MRTTALISICVLSFAVSPVFGELEGFAVFCENALCVGHAPKVSAPKGWIKDSNATGAFQVAAYTPAGSTFAESDTAIYTKAVARSGQPKTLDEFIKASHAQFLSADPSMRIVRHESVPNGDEKKLVAYTYSSTTGEEKWQLVAYDETDTYYLLFALGTRSERSLQANKPAFFEVVRSYKK